MKKLRPFSFEATDHGASVKFCPCEEDVEAAESKDHILAFDVSGRTISGNLALFYALTPQDEKRYREAALAFAEKSRKDIEMYLKTGKLPGKELILRCDMLDDLFRVRGRKSSSRRA